MSSIVETPGARWPVRAVRWWARVPSGSILNDSVDSGSGRTDIAVAMRTTLAALLARHADDSGLVDYGGLAQSDSYREFRALTAGLYAFDPCSLTDDDARKAFWINLYNVLILDAVIALRLSGGPAHGWFERSAYGVGGYRFSANDIEHGILRSNRWHLVAAGPQFGRSDPRRQYAVSEFDPRIHFALNCAARSCPPIRAYAADRLDGQLDLATASFLKGGQLTLDRATMRIGLSRLFQYYGQDFGGGPFGLWGHAQLVRFAARFVPDADTRAFLTANATRLRVTFLRYDWSLNAYDSDPTTGTG